jgi:pimeloyl-ACP methyl ester carboxylesterase
VTDGSGVLWGRVERPDAEIWFADTGEDRPVVVLLHGLAGYALEWRRTIDSLRGHFCVVAPDQRGHGSSTRRPDDVSRAAYVGDVVAMLDELGVERVPVIGQSMGAHTAMLLAAAAPERVERLVMVEGGLGGDGPEATDGVARWLESWPAPFPDREEFVAFFGGQRFVAEAWADGLEQRSDGLWPCWDAATLTRALAAVHEREHVEEWGRVRAPTLLVRGELGSVPQRQVAAMREVRPDAEVVTVAGVGHDVHLEAPEVLHRLLGRFLGVGLAP